MAYCATARRASCFSGAWVRFNVSPEEEKEAIEGPYLWGAHCGSGREVLAEERRPRPRPARQKPGTSAGPDMLVAKVAPEHIRLGWTLLGAIRVPT